MGQEQGNANIGSPICNHHSGVVADINNLKESDKGQFVMIEKIKNRPPVWATAAISLLTFLLGCSVTYAGIISHLANTGLAFSK